MILPVILLTVLIMGVLFIALKINSGNVRNSETGKIYPKSNMRGGIRKRRQRRNRSNKKKNMHK